MRKFIIIFSLTLIYCSDDPTNSLDQSYSISDFPNKEGNQWLYAYYDSLSSTEDTVTVTIINSQNENGTTLWQYSFKTHTDTKFVNIKNDTVKISTAVTHPFPEMVFIFPLQVGKGWKGSYVSDTFNVMTKESLLVPAGEFTNAWLIEKQWGAFNDYGIIKTWFVPEVGIIKQDHIGWSFGLANNTWQLINYTIK